MTQRKDAQIVVAIEPAYHEVVKQVDQGNTSEYVRNLIIADIQKRGLLTNSLILRVYGIEAGVEG